jgi:hypothetical protein
MKWKRRVTNLHPFKVLFCPYFPPRMCLSFLRSHAFKNSFESFASLPSRGKTLEALPSILITIELFRFSYYIERTASILYVLYSSMESWRCSEYSRKLRTCPCIKVSKLFLWPPRSKCMIIMYAAFPGKSNYGRRAKLFHSHSLYIIKPESGPISLLLVLILRTETFESSPI